MKVSIEEVATGALVIMNITLIGGIIKGVYDLYGPGDHKCGEKMQTLVKRVKQDIAPTGN